MDPPSDQAVKQALARLVERLQRDLPPCRILLFGSRARGEHLLTSDVDVLVVSPSFRGVREDDRMVRVLEAWDGPVALEALCFTPEELAERQGAIGIVQVAVREGRFLA